jgi:butyrate kinase
MRAGEYLILTINPGSTSTKIGVYANEKPELVRNLSHSDEEMKPFTGRRVLDQLDFRLAAIERELAADNYDVKLFDAVVGRGGLMRNLPSGTYRVNEEMLGDLRLTRFGDHASNLGAFLARQIAREGSAEAFVVDPVSVDEWQPKARISGTALIERRSAGHMLNTKAVAKRYAREQGKKYADLRLVVVHMGSGVTASAHENGRMIDSHDPGHEGAFSTERSGGLPLLKVVQLCFSGKYNEQTMWYAFNRESGLYGYLGTRDLREVERRIEAGDAKAALIFDAMAYRIAKDVGIMATVLCGRVDAILLTGGMAHSKKLVDEIRPYVEWIAPIVVYPGEDELQAMAEGALRVLRHEEQARELEAEAVAVPFPGIVLSVEQ